MYSSQGLKAKKLKLKLEISVRNVVDHESVVHCRETACYNNNNNIIIIIVVVVVVVVFVIVVLGCKVQNG